MYCIGCYRVLHRCPTVNTSKFSQTTLFQPKCSTVYRFCVLPLVQVNAQTSKQCQHYNYHNIMVVQVCSRTVYCILFESVYPCKLNDQVRFKYAGYTPWCQLRTGSCGPLCLPYRFICINSLTVRSAIWSVLMLVMLTVIRVLLGCYT